MDTSAITTENNKIGRGLFYPASTYYSFFMVLRPKGRYSGHIPTRLVRTNTPASTSKTIPRVPEMMCVKYNTAMVTAIRILTTLSIVPMFFFIIVGF
jgi:hypothetical protein